MKPTDNTEPKQTDYNQPVAYDTEGRPLYAHPPKEDKKTVHQVVHFTRAVDPVQPQVSPKVKARHEQSKNAYPSLNLSEGEYIISAVRRHPIGLVIPLIVGTLLIAFSVSVALNHRAFFEFIGADNGAVDSSTLVVPLLLFCVLIGLGMFVVYYVYTNSKFFLTNESVIQEIQISLFSKLEQTVSLANIEDASYTQQGIMQQLFNYGSIRLSTEGDETTYRFTYVANPKKHIAKLNNAVEAFKNGRPVQDN